MNKKLLTLTITILLFSCSKNQNDFSSDTLAEKACVCMNREDGKGTIDERLSTCLMNSISANAGMIQATYYPNEAPDKAVEKHFYKITSNMIHNCDSYYSEMDKMYTNMYPETDYSELKYNIDSITDSLENLSLNDSAAINLLHEKIMLLTRSRKYDEALDAIDIMTSQYSRESETHWVKAYIYRDQKKYKEAIEELEKAISLGNENTIIFKELIVEKMRRQVTKPIRNAAEGGTEASLLPPRQSRALTFTKMKFNLNHSFSLPPCSIVPITRDESRTAHSQTVVNNATIQLF